MEKSNIQLTQKDAIWGFFTPFIEAIADKVSESDDSAESVPCVAL